MIKKSFIIPRDDKEFLIFYRPADGNRQRKVPISDFAAAAAAVDDLLGHVADAVTNEMTVAARDIVEEISDFLM